MPQIAAIRARGISKYFGETVALDGVDLDIALGQVHGLVGPNGAGKTTLLGLVLGLAVPDRGSLEILGQQVARSLPSPEGIAGFVDGPGLYPTLTARGNLLALGRLRGLDIARIDEVLDEVGLTDVADDRVRGFSLGMRQRLGLAAALLMRPEVLVLDEPANGLDPAGARQVHAVLARLAAQGAAVFLSSHRMDDLATLCDEVTILNGGRVAFSGPVAKLVAEVDELTYRVRTSESNAARAVAAATHAVTVCEDEPSGDDDVFCVRASMSALDEFVASLAASQIPLRELAPVMTALEAAYLSLTEGGLIEKAQSLSARTPSGTAS